MATLAINTRKNLAGPSLLISIGIIALLFVDNGPYLATCFLAIIMIFYILWHNNRPGILAFAFLKQWAQVVAYVIWMNVMGWEVRSLSPNAPNAIMVSCFGLTIMALIISWRIRNLPIPTREEFRIHASKFNIKKVFILYLVSTLFVSSLAYMLGAGSAFLQILNTLGGLKWMFFLLFGYISWSNKKSRPLLIGMILFEFGTGLVSYFSTFKEVFLYTIVLIFTFINRVTLKQVVYGAVGATILILFFIAWTAIKSDYRQYLNQGTKTQTVSVSKSAAVNKMGDQVKSLTSKDLQLASAMLLYRVQYIQHLTLTMDRVPQISPHEYGKVWWENVSFVLMPRVFFPDKPIYQATLKTNKYTGLRYSGLTGGTSFSLGYFADSYIDFGYLGMFGPLALLALYISFIYRTLYKLNKLNIILRYTIVCVVLYEFTAFESDGLFLFGRLTVMFLSYWVMGRILFPRLQTWLYK